MVGYREALRKELMQKKMDVAKKQLGYSRNDVEAAFYKSAVEQMEKADKVSQKVTGGVSDKYWWCKLFPAEEIIGKEEDRKAVVEFRKVGKEGLDKLKPLEHQVLLHWSQGCTYKEIGAIVNIDLQNVYKIVKKDDFKKAYNELMADAAKVSKDSQALLQHNSSNAARRLLHLMNNAGSEHVQLQAAREVLDRGGVPAIKRTETIGDNTVTVNLEGFPDDYKQALMERKLKEIEASRRRRIGHAVESFEVPEIVDGEVVEERYDYGDVEFGGMESDKKW